MLEENFNARHDKNTLCGYPYRDGTICSEKKIANEERCILHLVNDKNKILKTYRGYDQIKNRNQSICNFQMGDLFCEELKEDGKKFCKFHELNKIEDFYIQIKKIFHQKTDLDFEGFYFPSNMKFDFFPQGFETKSAVKFKDAEFNCDLIVPNGAFGDYVDFTNCRFNKKVEFNDCTFTHATVFSEAQFLSGVIFYYTRFNTTTFFSKTKFKGELLKFIRIIPSSLLKFEGTEFSSNFNIFEDIDFSNSQTYLINSQFNESTNFDYCNLQNVSFYECNLSNCNLSKSNILPAKFISCNWDLERKNGQNKKETKHRIILKDEEILFSKKYQDKKNFIKQLGLVESCYRVFKVNRDTEKDYDNAHKFYHSEMEMKRRKAWENFKISQCKSKLRHLSRALFLKLYKCLSGYGNRPGRAIIKLFLLLFFMSLPLVYIDGLIPTYHFKNDFLNTKYERVNKASTYLRDSFLMTIYNLTAIYRSDINLFKVQNEADVAEEKAKNPKFIGKPINPFTLIYIAFIQYIIRPIQITLIVLAIRRKVQRG